MTVQSIPLNSEIASERLEVTLEDQVYEFQTWWNNRTQGWYLSTYKVLEGGDRRVLTQGFRLRPGSRPVSSGARLEFPGDILVVGPEDYDRGDLGDDLKLVYITSDDEVFQE
jgi:hypothetical protein